MPISRFEIRNQYSLADSDLYRAADKDDPEALLEGVAMAGLVGVLRQLGDLAEFAAEIFHNLHEEVMATAMRGHSLLIRVQQLEAEVPFIERAFLSQTDHSSFFYHAGVDWHPNLRIETNLVTRGDLPRFIMDSYEECRAPPRLFLLDKFDVAGAGACLKRYTDPSFFKVEMSDMTRADVQREKKILKPKKKGPRWRNGETPEVIPTSHSKLHQLFMEDRVENGVNNHIHRAKLKRRLSGFPFDSKTGKSYMEKILKSTSPVHKVLREVNVNSLSPLMPARSEQNESEVEVLEVRPMSPDTRNVERERSLHPSPDRKDIFPSPSIYKSSEVTTEDQIRGAPNSYHSFATGETSSAIDVVTTEKVIAVDPENNIEGCLTGYKSDGIASEAENYMDATSTMETEMDTEAESRMKNEFTPLHVTSQSFISEANEEHHDLWISDCQSTGDSTISNEGKSSSKKQMSACSSSVSATCGETEIDTEAESRMKDDISSQHGTSQLLISDANDEHPSWISDCQSTGDSMISDEGNSSCKKEISACSSSDSASTSAENSKLEESSSRILSADTHENEIVAASSHQKNADEGVSVDQHSKTVICDDECTSTDAINNHSSDSKELTNLYCNESVHPLVHTESEGITRQIISKQRESSRILSADTHENEMVAASSHQKNADEGFSLDQHSETVICDDESTSTDAINNHSSDSEELTSLYCNESVRPLVHTESEGITRQIISKQYESNDIAITLDNDEKKTNLLTDQQCHPLASDFELQSGDNEARLSAGKDPVNESNGDIVPSTSAVPDVNCKITDSSATKSLNLLHEDGPEQKDQNLVENAALSCYMFNDLSQSKDGAPEMASPRNPISGESGDEFPKLLENLPSDYPDNGADIKSTVSQEENLINELHYEDSNAPNDASNCADVMEASLGEKINETFLANAHTVDADENCSHSLTQNLLSSENSIMLHLSNSPDGQQADLDADKDDGIPKQETTEYGTSELGSPTSSDVVGLQGTGLTDSVPLDGSEALGSSFHTLKNLEDPSGTLTIGEMDGTIQCLSSAAHEFTGIYGLVDPESPNKANVLLDGPDSEGEESNINLASTVHVVELQAMGVTDRVSLDDSEALGSSLHTLENLGEPSGKSDATEMDTTTLMSSMTHEVTRIWGSPDLKSPNEANKLEADLEGEKSHIDFRSSVHVSDNAVVDNADSYMDLHEVVDEHIHCLDDSGLDELENNTNSLSESHRESDLVEEEIQTEAAGSDSEAILCNCVVDDDQKSETSDTVPISHLDAEVDDRQESVDATTTKQLWDPSGLGTEHGLFQQCSLGNDVSDTKCYPADYNSEESKVCENLGLPPNPFDRKLPLSAETSPESSIPLLPITHLQMLDPGDHKGDNDSNPMISLVDCPNPPSILPELPRQSSHGNGVSGFPKDPLCSNFPPINPFSKANEINLVNLPPLPPLPPVQWRMGKIQQNSSYTDGEVVKHKELPLQAIAPLDASTVDYQSSSVTTSTDDVSSFPVATSTVEIGTFPQTTLSTDDVSSSHVMACADFVSSALGEKMNSSLEELTNAPIQTVPEPASEVEVKLSCSTLEIKDAQETIDVSPNIEEKQHQSVMPAPKSEFASPEEDGGVSQGIRAVKLQWPRNPLVEDVSALDKSKLRKVSERVMPQIQKVGERDSFLEQIRNQTFSLKPAMASRPAIQHPKTNLRVAAILEKANAIRQALADSDEEDDDDDSWSDS